MTGVPATADRLTFEIAMADCAAVPPPATASSTSRTAVSIGTARANDSDVSIIRPPDKTLTSDTRTRPLGLSNGTTVVATTAPRRDRKPISAAPLEPIVTSTASAGVGSVRLTLLSPFAIFTWGPRAKVRPPSTPTSGNASRVEARLRVRLAPLSASAVMVFGERTVMRGRLGASIEMVVTVWEPAGA